jgi:TPR repeat protein
VLVGRLALLAVVSCAAPLPPLTACIEKGDCTRARALCDEGDINACVASRDYVLACQLNVTACSEAVSWGRIRGCQGARDEENDWLRFACDSGYPPACARIADKLVDGIDLPRDTERAAILYASVCDAADRFPRFARTTYRGGPFPIDDPMGDQLGACVRNERLVELGLGHTRARTSPERAVELSNERAVRYQGVRIERTVSLELERRRALGFAHSAEERAKAAREERASEVPLCGALLTHAR